jgi:hypothetical protein
MRKSQAFWSLARMAVIVLLPLFLIGCAAVAPVVMRPLTTTPLVYCHEGTGHIAGTAPWILGGKCCCTPTRAMFQIHQAEKTVAADLTYAAYLKLYADRGILVGPEHAGCNNRCAAAPHVVLGGKCMAAPTPGTQNYENVSRGEKPVSQVTKGKRSK